MNATAATRRIARPAARLAAGLVAAFAVLLGLVGPASAATGYYYVGNLSMNSYYGWAGGNAYVTSDFKTAQVNLQFRDNRDDGACSVIHTRFIYQSGAATGAYKLGNNCSTITPNAVNRSFSTTALFDDVQIRACKSDRYGNVIGACSGWVTTTNWRVQYYTY